MTQTTAAARRVVVLGGGTAGLIAAGILKREHPDLDVTVMRSPSINHVMVGEGSVGSTPAFIHDRLGLPVDEFFTRVRPTPKFGIRFNWGPRPHFDYTFERQYARRTIGNGSTELGFLCPQSGTLDDVSLASALMSRNHVPQRFARSGTPCTDARQREPAVAYHFENAAFVDALDWHARTLDVSMISDTVVGALTEHGAVRQVRMASGRHLAADLWVDASGFRRVLLGEALGEPIVSFADQLLCDRAVVGGWERADDEPIKPFTTAETMQAGWCWQIEHHDLVNRGYVYSSAHISDVDAEAEFRARNPRVGDVRIVPFSPRRSRRAWVSNVVAIGNACGFVEPLEATNIQVITAHAASISSSLAATRHSSEHVRRAHNMRVERQWSRITDFLALHYRLNTRLDTPFWRDARATSIGALDDLLDFYQAVGPSSAGDVHVPPADPFGLDGHYAMMVGMAPRNDSATPAQLRRFAMYQAAVGLEATQFVNKTPATR